MQNNEKGKGLDKMLILAIKSSFQAPLVKEVEI